MKNFVYLLMICVAAGLVSCKEQEAQVKRESRFEPFIKKYNSHIAQWLQEQLVKANATVAEIEKELAATTDPELKEKLEKRLENCRNVVKKYQDRATIGEYFSFKTQSDLPEGLDWKDGMNEPIIGDPNAKKGGTFHTWILDFPTSLRPVGPNSNNSFRGYLYDGIEIGLVGIHPLTQGLIPGVAKKWAFSEDRKTCYFELDPDAAYSDGVKVKAKDFMFYAYIRLSDDISAPFQKQYFREQIANMTVYGESHLSITISDPKSELGYVMTANVAPSPPHFYDEYGPDYDVRYNWRIQPTTGAYTVHPEDIKKGRSITLSRVKDWWAKDKKYYQHAYNADKISYQVIAEQSKAFELFRLGKLDTFALGAPDYWYERMEISEYFDGYIEKDQFYNVYPRLPRGFYLNVVKAPLNDLNVRIGLEHALNFKKVNTIIFRGDAERLKQFSEGYGEFTNPNIEPREYSVSKARDYFAKAGYTKRDREGYLKNAAGKRLQIELSWPQLPIYNQMMALLKEDAHKAGLELILDGAQQMVNYRKVMEKRHQAAFSAWQVLPPFPSYYQFFHSDNAFDDKGNLKQQTNNLNSYKDEEMDRLCEAERAATSDEVLKQASWRIQQIIHDQVLFIPALKTSYVRMAHWRWVKWPDTDQYQFSSPVSYLPEESYLYWIDEEVQKETLEAKARGEKFPEKNNLFDMYRNGIPPVKEAGESVTE